MEKKVRQIRSLSRGITPKNKQKTEEPINNAKSPKR